MEFTHTFRVPVGIDEAFATLTDLERVAPCLPGATLEEVEGDTYRGHVKVKVGPISVTYSGTARMAEADAEGKVARIEAAGKEARGSGTAKADVLARLTVVSDDETEVAVTTDLAITGKPAQFGRGVMADVGSRIIDSFAERLQAMLSDGDEAAAGDQPAEGNEAAASGAAAAGSDSPGEDGGVRRIAAVPGREDDALDLMDVAGAATIKRVAPLVGLVLAVVGLVWWLRR